MLANRRHRSLVITISGIVIAWMCCACASDPKRGKTAEDAVEPNIGGGAPTSTPTPMPTPAHTPSPSLASDAGSSSGEGSSGGCLVVQGDYGGQPSTVEGILKLAEGSKKSPAPLVLRLARPRCVVGLAHASYIVEVYVASTGTDLRPLIDAHVRITGDVVGGTTDMGGAAVVVLAKDVERLRSD